MAFYSSLSLIHAIAPRLCEVSNKERIHSYTHSLNAIEGIQTLYYPIPTSDETTWIMIRPSFVTSQSRSIVKAGGSISKFGLHVLPTLQGSIVLKKRIPRPDDYDLDEDGDINMDAIVSEADTPFVTTPKPTPEFELFHFELHSQQAIPFDWPIPSFDMGDKQFYIRIDLPKPLTLAIRLDLIGYNDVIRDTTDSILYTDRHSAAHIHFAINRDGGPSELYRYFGILPESKYRQIYKHVSKLRDYDTDCDDDYIE